LRYTTSEENYLKAIWKLESEGLHASTNAISERLNTRPASVTDMLKKLTEKKLLHYQSHRGVKLTSEGKKISLAIVRRHRLWESFLVEKLHFPWHEVHDIAEELEHISNPSLIERLDRFLGQPKTDPHGDPIPDKEGIMKEQKQIPLSALPENQPARIAAVSDRNSDLLELLTHKKIQIGTELKVLKRFSFDGSAEIQLKGRNQKITVSTQLADSIFILTDYNAGN
jgi:DtxR family Mn-dependent transcriptional regulator